MSIIVFELIKHYYLFLQLWILDLAHRKKLVQANVHNISLWTVHGNWHRLM